MAVKTTMRSTLVDTTIIHYDGYNKYILNHLPVKSCKDGPVVLGTVTSKILGSNSTFTIRFYKT